jgi:hypothetical protein
VLGISPRPELAQAKCNLKPDSREANKIAWFVLSRIGDFKIYEASDGVAYVAHGGGLIAGALLFLLLRPAGVRLFECVEPPGEETPVS